jgi:putative ABC transport system ATP-binding protein
VQSGAPKSSNQPFADLERQGHAVPAPAARGSLVVLQQVSKVYRGDGEAVHALEDISLEISPGSLVALVGRSGCGKSTLLNMAGAMDFPTSGRVLWEGVSTSSLDDAGLTRLRREKVGFVFQSFQLLPTLTVIENVELPLLLAGRAGVRAAATEMLLWVELDGLEGRYPHQLSGGQMQRTAIARALVHRPRLVLADEPTGNLDTATGNVILALLSRIAAEQKTAVLMATHSEEAAATVGVVFHMRDGRIEQVLRR